MKKIDKLIEHIESQGGNYAEFERKAGISNAYIKNTNGRNADIGQKILDKIKKNLPEEYEKIFGNGGDIEESENLNEGNKEPGSNEKSLLALLMKEMASLMRTQNNLLRDQKTLVVDKVNNIDSNLKQVYAAVIKISSDIDSSKDVVLESLARLEKLPKGSLTGEAHKIVKRRVLGVKK